MGVFLGRDVKWIQLLTNKHVGVDLEAGRKKHKKKTKQETSEPTITRRAKYLKRLRKFEKYACEDLRSLEAGAIKMQCHNWKGCAPVGANKPKAKKKAKEKQAEENICETVAYKRSPLWATLSHSVNLSSVFKSSTKTLQDESSALSDTSVINVPSSRRKSSLREEDALADDETDAAPLTSGLSSTITKHANRVASESLKYAWDADPTPQPAVAEAHEPEQLPSAAAQEQIEKLYKEFMSSCLTSATLREGTLSVGGGSRAAFAQRSLGGTGRLAQHVSSLLQQQLRSDPRTAIAELTKRIRASQAAKSKKPQGHDYVKQNISTAWVKKKPIANPYVPAA